MGRIQTATSGRSIDRVVEVAFEANLETNLKVLKVGGVIATYATGSADAAPRIPFYRLIFQGITVMLRPCLRHARGGSRGSHS